MVWRIGKLKPLLEARSHCHPYALTVTLIGLKCQLQSVHSVRGRNCLFHQVLKLEGPTDGCWTKEDCQEPSLNSRVSELNILQMTEIPEISQVFTKNTSLQGTQALKSYADSKALWCAGNATVHINQSKELGAADI